MPKWQYIQLKVNSRQNFVFGDENKFLLSEIEYKALFEEGDDDLIDYFAAIDRLGGIGWDLVSERALPNDPYVFFATFKRSITEKDSTLYYLLTDLFATHSGVPEHQKHLEKLHNNGALDDEEYADLSALLKAHPRPFKPHHREWQET